MTCDFEDAMYMYMLTSQRFYIISKHFVTNIKYSSVLEQNTLHSIVINDQPAYG